MIRNLRVFVITSCIVFAPWHASANAVRTSASHEVPINAATTPPRVVATLPQAPLRGPVVAMEDVRTRGVEATSARFTFARSDDVVTRDVGAGDEASPVSRYAILIVGLGIALISIARRMGRY